MILIAAIENHKNPEIDVLIAEYLKRLQPLHAVSLTLLPAARVNSSEQQQIKETEALLKLAKPGDTLFLLDETGKQTNSLEFSNLITQSLNQSRGKIIFCIGGAYGFTAEAKQKFPKLKMSDWVFPHQIARLVLVEQIYRSFNIIKGTGYHHQ
jgi:23S rRNA (pseudouridine1915-N3)-methyltransferase